MDSNKELRSSSFDLYITSVYLLLEFFLRCQLRRFHSHANGFGKGLIDGRLTQNFFFNVKDT